MNLSKPLLIFILFFAFSHTAIAKNKNVFYNPNLGFGITKLDSWYFVSPNTSFETVKQTKTRGDLAVSKNSVPLVTIAKKTMGPVQPILEVRANSLKGLKGIEPSHLMETRV